MSGGVDSSVSAALLHKGLSLPAGKQADVIGVYMKCWSADDPLSENCSTVDDERMARLAASHIGIPFYTVNLIDEYKKRVVRYLLEGYKKGITPNPDVMCNKEIKFGLFFEKAMELGADYVATGHYARLRRETLSFKPQIPNKKGKNIQILQGVDTNKDQSYFLSLIKPEVLGKVLFPIGEYTKPQVRKLAKQFGLPNAERKDSQGICFVGKVDFTDFLKQYIPSKQGNIIDMQGNILGKHDGAFYYTIGQRKGLGLGGGPYFVVAKNIAHNTIMVSKNSKDLLQKKMRITDINWFTSFSEIPKGTQQAKEVEVRIRYRQKPALGVIKIDNDGISSLVFKKEQWAIAPGQTAVLYSGSRMVAGGTITR
jgi:tRNA-uridine 2-sulfurtransferase